MQKKNNLYVKSYCTGEKGCLTTFEGKKQKGVVKCFGSQSFESCAFLAELARTKEPRSGASLWTPGPRAQAPGAAAAVRRGSPLFALSGKISFCKDVGNISQRPPFL